MKLGPVTNLDKRNDTTSKKLGGSRLGLKIVAESAR